MLRLEGDCQSHLAMDQSLSLFNQIVWTQASVSQLVKGV